jgi:hypothetical protein
MLPVFLGFVALSVDTAALAVARGQLSTAADASALAAAQNLANEYRVRGVSDMTSQIATANSTAASFAQANFVLGNGVSLSQNASNATGGDVMVGYLDPTSTTSTLVTASASQSLFNAVQVTTRRDASHGGKVPTFFGGLMGYSGTSMSVSSTAVAANYTIKAIKPAGNNSAHLLPIVLDVSTYNQILAKATTDQYTYNPTTGAVSSGADGVFESVLYPVSAGNPGNWGTIQVGVSNNSTSTLSAQIQYGITPQQLATFPGGVIQLDSTLTPPSITFNGNPGISAGIKSALDAIVGQPVMIPIYDQTGGNGNNAWYRVIAFAGMRILSVNFQGNPKYVVVQPALISDPTAVPGSPQSSWSNGGLIVLHLAK